MNDATARTLEHLQDHNTFRLAPPFEGAVVRYSKPRDGVLDLYSTFVPNDLRGKGLAEDLVQQVLQHVREHQLKVIPSCWYVARYIDRNGEYADLLA